MNVFDASALLAFLQGEDGAAAVEAGLSADGACGTANWSEVAQKIRAHGRDWDLARALLASYDLRLEPVSVADAELAAATWTSRLRPVAGGPAVSRARAAPRCHRVDSRYWLGKQRDRSADPLTTGVTVDPGLP